MSMVSIFSIIKKANYFLKRRPFYPNEKAKRHTTNKIEKKNEKMGKDEEYEIVKPKF